MRFMNLLKPGSFGRVYEDDACCMLVPYDSSIINPEKHTETISRPTETPCRLARDIAVPATDWTDSKVGFGGVNYIFFNFDDMIFKDF